jgi:hypothetical protein
MKSTPALTTTIDGLRADGIEVVFREARGCPCSDAITRGEFADVEKIAKVGAIACHRSALALFGALKALNVVYSENDGGLVAFDTDAEIIYGSGDQQARLSRNAHLLIEAETALPKFPESMRDFAAHVWGSLFHFFVGSVYRLGEAVERLEAFQNAEGLAAQAVEVAGGVWVVDARKSSKPNFHAVVHALGNLPGCKMGLVRKRSVGPPPPGGPQLGLMLIDQESGRTQFEKLGIRDLPPEFAALLQSSPDLDVPDLAWTEIVVPALVSMFGPPTHV